MKLSKIHDEYGAVRHMVQKKSLKSDHPVTGDYIGSKNQGTVFILIMPWALIRISPQSTGETELIRIVSRKN